MTDSTDLEKRKTPELSGYKFSTLMLAYSSDLGLWCAFNNMHAKVLLKFQQDMINFWLQYFRLTPEGEKERVGEPILLVWDNLRRAFPANVIPEKSTGTEG